MMKHVPKVNKKTRTTSKMNKQPSHNKPSRPLTSYNYFFHDERLKLQERLFKVHGQRPTYTQISRLVGASWRKISADKKAYYDTLAMQDRRRYALELVAMKSKHEQSESEAGINQKSNVEAHTCAPSRTGSSTLNQTDGQCLAPFLTTTHSDCLNSFFIPTTIPHGVDPNSPSLQAMLGQTISGANSSHSTNDLFVPMTDISSSFPNMTAQIALLSVMMIEYVRKVAPERIVDNNDGPTTLRPQPSSVVTSLLHDDLKLPQRRNLLPVQEHNHDELLTEVDVQFLGKTFGFDE